MYEKYLTLIQDFLEKFINYFFSTNLYFYTGIFFILILLFMLVKRMSRRRGKKVVNIDAKKLEKSGLLREAAEAYLVEKKFVKAAEIFMRIGLTSRAAECYELMGQKQTAASLYERAGNIREAVDIYISLGMVNEAIQLLERNGKYYEAGEIAEKAKMYEVAGYMFEKCGMNERAGENYFRAKNYKKASIFLKKEFDEHRKHSRDIPRELAKMLSICLENAGDYFEAGKIYYLLGEKEKAAEQFEKSGEFEMAYRLYKEIGQEERASKLGELIGKSVEKEFSADELELQVTSAPPVSFQTPDARVEELLRKGEYKKAGEILLKAGKLRESAEIFSKGKEYLLAAQVYQKIGDPIMQSEMLFKGEKYFEAVLNLYETGNLREAEEMIKAVPPHSPDYRRCCIILGDILFQRGDLKKAAEAYGKAIKGERIRQWNIMAFYRLGNIAEEAKNYDAALVLYNAIEKYDEKFMDITRRIKRLEEILKKEKPSKEETVPRYIVKEVDKQPPAEKAEPHRFSIIEEIGRGGMGVVYRAKDNFLERFVALKVLPSYMKKEKGAIENFVKEAKATAALSHPNIVTIYDAGEQDGNYYIAMELVEGETLKEMIKKYGRIGLKAFFVMAAQICKAISYAHSRSIIHRDIKPSNIMWTKDKMVKVMDLGLAKVIQDAANFHTVVGGTPHYMSPEQILGEEITFSTDIYSLGVTFYEMLTGTVPFPKGNVGYHHVHTPPPPLRKFNPSIPEELEKIVLKCLEKKKEDRFQSVDELYSELKKVAEKFQK